MRKLPRWLLVVGVLLTLLGVSFAVVASRFEPIARQKILELLQERYSANISIGNLRVSLFPFPQATGEALTFRETGQKSGPPLVTVRRFTVQTNWAGILRSPKHISRVQLEGLEILISHQEGDKPDAKTPTPSSGGQEPQHSPFLIGEVIADGTRLTILPKQEGKEPLSWNISKLTLHSAGLDRPMQFRAELMNAKPPGLIHSDGEFGPWQKQNAGATPVKGSYTFEKADLSVFKGIGGTLSSKGSYNGTLDHIDVNGTTDTPDFRLTIANHPMPLTTRFHAIVDGTKGDTLLQPVDAQLGKTPIHTEGGVTSTPGRKGKTIALNAVVANGRVEDILRLTVKSSQPLMVGGISFRSTILIPPGEQDVMEKIRLNGTFAIASARFTNLNLQQKLTKASQRSRGQLEDNPEERIASHFRGKFRTGNGTASLQPLNFSIPGAEVQLSGEYGLRSQEMDFRGQLALDAKVSQLTSGFKSFLLKAVDPLFKKQGKGAVIPITIGGTREHPRFGIDMGRLFKRNKGTEPRKN